MEDVLDVYSGEYDDGTVLVCMDETSKQQTKETRAPLPVRPGQPAGYDFEYERNGTANLFMIFAPLDAWRHVKVTDRRTQGKSVLRNFLFSFIDMTIGGGLSRSTGLQSAMSGSRQGGMDRKRGGSFPSVTGDGDEG